MWLCNIGCRQTAAGRDNNKSSLMTLIVDKTLSYEVFVILDVLIKSAKLACLEDAESHKENNAENEWVDTTQYQILHLKVTTECGHNALGNNVRHGKNESKADNNWQT